MGNSPWEAAESLHHLGNCRASLCGAGAGAQRFFPRGTISTCSAASLASALACLAARFSFRDLPSFLDMVWRGDLSVMVALPGGALWLLALERTPPGRLPALAR